MAHRRVRRGRREKIIFLFVPKTFGTMENYSTTSLHNNLT